jgi:hypothetical protein
MRCRTCHDTYTGRTCLRCKRNQLAVSKGLHIALCKECHLPAHCSRNGVCHQCMRAMGLKECATCRSVEIELLFFNKHQSRCKTCEGLTPRAREKAESRKADEAALAAGKSPQELQQENSHFARLKVRWVGGRLW